MCFQLFTAMQINDRFFDFPQILQRTYFIENTNFFSSNQFLVHTHCVYYYYLENENHFFSSTCHLCVVLLSKIGAKTSLTNESLYCGAVPAVALNSWHIDICGPRSQTHLCRDDIFLRIVRFSLDISLELARRGFSHPAPHPASPFHPLATLWAFFQQFGGCDSHQGRWARSRSPFHMWLFWCRSFVFTLLHCDWNIVA